MENCEVFPIGNNITEKELKNALMLEATFIILVCIERWVVQGFSKTAGVLPFPTSSTFNGLLANFIKGFNLGFMAPNFPFQLHFLYSLSPPAPFCSPIVSPDEITLFSS